MTMKQETTPTTPATDERGMVMRGLLLLVMTCVILFVGVIGAFGLTMGIEIAPLYAPLIAAAPTIIMVGVGATAFGLAVYVVAPALRAYYSPSQRSARAERDLLLQEITAATSRAQTAEGANLTLSATLQQWQAIIADDHRVLFPNDKKERTPEEMLQATRVEVLTLRPATLRADTLFQERNDLRDRVAQLLSIPTPKTASWQGALALVGYARTTAAPSVRRVRDDLRAAGIAIPEGEYTAFSTAVRALPALSPISTGVQVAPVASVPPAISLPKPTLHGRESASTDGQTRSRIQRTQRTRRPAPFSARYKEVPV